jgi:2-polyprenyl-3-methyl-5-hydroxy-6-metoxy-1,4-benzoquinol methylase
MPGSDSSQIPAVLTLVGEANPRSVLDIGVGWGRYGALFRLTFERGEANISDRNRWTIRIDGIEVHSKYIGEIQRAVYDNILIGDVNEISESIGSYDAIFLGDVIEHIEKPKAMSLLNRLLVKAERIVVATPNGEYEQGALLGNEYEAHRSAWHPEDFLKFPHAEIYANSKSVIAVISTRPITSAGRRWRMYQYRRYPVMAGLSARLRYRLDKWRKRKTVI